MGAGKCSEGYIRGIDQINNMLRIIGTRSPTVGKRS